MNTTETSAQHGEKSNQILVVDADILPFSFHKRFAEQRSKLWVPVSIISALPNCGQLSN